MIHFSDSPEKKSLSEIASSTEFSSILSKGENVEDARDYWDQMFAETTEVTTITEEELAAEIFDRHPEEFSFDFPFDDEVTKAITRFDADEWCQLTVKERLAAIETFVELVGARLGLERIPDVKLFEGADNVLGAYVRGENQIELNEALLNKPQDLLKTLAHEIRHAYQYEHSLALETWEDFLYYVNFENYISPGVDENGYYHSFADYEDQLVEAEARAFAKLFTSQEG